MALKRKNESVEANERWKARMKHVRREVFQERASSFRPNLKQGSTMAAQARNSHACDAIKRFREAKAQPIVPDMVPTTHEPPRSGG